MSSYPGMTVAQAREFEMKMETPEILELFGLHDETSNNIETHVEVHSMF